MLFEEIGRLESKPLDQIEVELSIPEPWHHLHMIDGVGAESDQNNRSLKTKLTHTNVGHVNGPVVDRRREAFATDRWDHALRH